MIAVTAGVYAVSIAWPIWGCGAAIYIVANRIIRRSFAKDLRTSAGIAPFISVSANHFQIETRINAFAIYLRDENGHAQARNWALVALVPILLVLFLLGGVANFIFGMIVSIPTVLLLARLLKTPLGHRKFMIKRATAALSSIEEIWMSDMFQELQQLSIHNSDLAHRMGNDSWPDSVKIIVDAFERDKTHTLDDPSRLQLIVSAELSKARRERHRLEDALWNDPEENRHTEDWGESSTRLYTSPYEVLGVAPDTPDEHGEGGEGTTHQDLSS